MHLPPGIIALWFGAIVDIPAGWTLCDGTLGTPDLRDRFLMGAAGAQAPDDTGGNPNHNHPFTADSHFHTLNAGVGVSAGAVLGQTTDAKSVTGTTDNTSIRPPWYALAYMMKL